MPIFEIQDADGTTYEIDAPSQEAAIQGWQNRGTSSPEATTEAPSETPEEKSWLEGQVTMPELIDSLEKGPEESLEQSNRKAVLQHIDEARYGQGRATLKQLQQLRAEGRPLPRWRNDLYAGADAETRTAIQKLYETEEGFEADPLGPWFTGRIGSLGGDAIPSDFPGDNIISELMHGTQAGRALWGAPQSVEDGIKQIIDSGASLVDATGLPGRVGLDITEYTDYVTKVGGENAPGDSLIEKSVDELARVLPVVVATPGGVFNTLAKTKAGLVAQITAIGALEGLAAKEGSGLTPLEQYMRGMATDEDRAEALGRIGLAVDLAITTGLGQSVVNLGSFALKMGKESVAKHLARLTSKGYAKNQIGEQFILDILAPVDMMDKKSRLEVTKVIKQSLQSGKGKLPEGDAFTKLFNDLNVAKRGSPIQSELEAVQDHLMTMKAATDTKKGVLPKTAAADRAFKAGAETQLDEVSGAIPEGAIEKSAETVQDMRGTLQSVAEDVGTEAQTLPRRISDASIAAERSAHDKAIAMYESAKELARDIPLSKRQLKSAKALKFKPLMKKGATMEDGINSLRQLREMLGRTKSIQEYETIQELVESIYTLGGKKGKGKLAAAREFYSKEFKQLTDDPLGGPGAGQFGRMGGQDTTIPSSATQRQYGVDTTRKVLDPAAEPEPREALQTLLERHGQPGEAQMVDDAMSVATRKEIADEKLEDFTHYAQDHLDIRGKRPSAEAPQQRFDDMFSSPKGAGDKVRAMLEEARKLPADQEEQFKQGMRKAWFESLRNKIFSTEGASKVLDPKKVATTEDSSFWKVTDQLFPDEQSKKGFNTLVKTMNKIRDVQARVGGSANRSVPEAVRAAFVGDSKAHAAKNILVTMLFGVLNPVATRARNIGGMAIDALTEKTYRTEFLDDVLSNPETLSQFAETMEANLEKNLGWEKVKPMIDNLFKRSLVRGFNRGGEDGDARYTQELEKIRAMYEQEQLESE